MDVRFGYQVKIGLSIKEDFVLMTRFDRMHKAELAARPPVYVASEKLPTLLYQLVMAGYMIARDPEKSNGDVTIIVGTSPEMEADVTAQYTVTPKLDRRWE